MTFPIDWQKYRIAGDVINVANAYIDHYGLSYRAMHYIALAQELRPIKDEAIASIVLATARELQIVETECRQLKL